MFLFLSLPETISNTAQTWVEIKSAPKWRMDEANRDHRVVQRVVSSLYTHGCSKLIKYFHFKGKETKTQENRQHVNGQYLVNS